MSKKIILEDKLISTGTSPIYKEEYQKIGDIKYHLFNLRGKIEVFKNGELISYGSAKILTFMPKWEIFSANGDKMGEINRKITFFKKEYEYIHNNKIYKIKGDFLSRKFKIYNSKNELVIDVDNTSNIISLRPYNFVINLLTDEISEWEAISLVQGIRALVKIENSNNNHGN